MAATACAVGADLGWLTLDKRLSRPAARDSRPQRRITIDDVSPVRARVQVVGRRMDPEHYRLRDFLTRTAQPYEWYEAGSAEADLLVARLGLVDAALPRGPRPSAQAPNSTAYLTGGPWSYVGAIASTSASASAALDRGGGPAAKCSRKARSSRSSGNSVEIGRSSSTRRSGSRLTRPVVRATLSA